MDVTSLRENQHLLIAHMENAGYEKKYVNKFKCEIRHILQMADAGKLACYADAYRVYEQKEHTQGYLRQKRGIIGEIEQFDLFGSLPDGTQKQKLLPKSACDLLCAEYKSIVDYYICVETKRRKQESTIRNGALSASVFLLSLQQSGVGQLAGINETHVLRAFVTHDGEIIRHYACKQRVAEVMKTCIPAYPDCEKVLRFLPAFKRRRKNIQYLTSEEVSKFRQTLSDKTTALSLRDKAVGILALYTGLRRSDIAGLKMESIDFDNDLLHIHQQKTGTLLILPLSAIVGNALYDYITKERAKSECEYVFLSTIRPFGRLCAESINDIISRIMDAADIREKPGDRRGAHIFRHHLVTSLLGNGVSRPITSSLVGHTSPRSLDEYLSADFPHLKKCAISIEQFPISQEVFTNE